MSPRDGLDVVEKKETPFLHRKRTVHHIPGQINRGTQGMGWLDQKQTRPVDDKRNSTCNTTARFASSSFTTLPVDKWKTNRSTMLKQYLALALRDLLSILVLDTNRDTK